MEATQSVDFLKADAWHDYFERKGLDEFEVIENAIAVAAWYRPDEFLQRRAHLTEILYAKKKPLPRCKENSKSVSSSVAPPKVSNVRSKTGKTFVRNPDGNYSIKQPIPVQDAPQTSEGLQAAPQTTTKLVQDALQGCKTKISKATHQDKESSTGAKQERSGAERCQSQKAHDHHTTRTAPACTLNNEVKFKGDSTRTTTRTKKLQDGVQESKENQKLDDAAMEMTSASSKKRVQDGYGNWQSDSKRVKTLLFTDPPLPPQVVRNHTRWNVAMNGNC